MSSRGWAEGLAATKVDFDGAIAWVTLARPDAANARNQQMREELKGIWNGLASSEDISVVILGAEGDRFFCAGMDLKEAGEPETPAQRRDRLRASRDIEQLAALPQPTIAAINGYAMGGGLEMALACDIRIAADTAQMGLTELVHGLVPGGGGTQRLPRLVGSPRAAEMLYLGLKVTAAQAEQWGLINRAVPGDELRAATSEMAQAIASQPPRALRYAKELLRQSLDVPVSVGAQLELDSLLTLMADQQA
ncbi:MAG: enoyl-CoA hydratase-related protein [Microthrixaceae bacterium]